MAVKEEHLDAKSFKLGSNRARRTSLEESQDMEESEDMGESEDVEESQDMKESTDMEEGTFPFNRMIRYRADKITGQQLLAYDERYKPTANNERDMVQKQHQAIFQHSAWTTSTPSATRSQRHNQIILWAFILSYVQPRTSPKARKFDKAFSLMAGGATSPQAQKKQRFARREQPQRDRVQIRTN